MIKKFIHNYIKSLSWLFVKLYFWSIETNGKENIPAKGQPFIFAPNHQNAFLDPVILGALADRPISYLARADAFVKPWDYFLDAFNMLPVYRMRDGFSNLSKNEEIFERCTERLKKGGGMLMFPEGSQDDVYYLRPLTKGIARIALQTQSRIDEDLLIIPVGLNYYNHFASGRKLILNYGKPYSVKKFDALFQEDPNKAYRKFILELSMAMKEVLVVESHSEHYTNHASVFTRANENLGFKALKSLVSTHKKFPKDKVYGFLKPIILLLELPNFIPFALINYAKKNILKKPVFHASVKLGVAVVIMPFWFLFTLVFLGLTFNLKVALIVFAIQILTLFIRSRLTRFIH